MRAGEEKTSSPTERVTGGVRGLRGSVGVRIGMIAAACVVPAVLLTGALGLSVVAAALAAAVVTALAAGMALGALMRSPIGRLASRVDALAAGDARPEGDARALPAELEPLGDALDRAVALVARRQREIDETQRLAGVGTWRVTPATGATEWSAAMYAIFGRDLRDGPPSFRQYLEQIEPGMRELVRERFRTARRTGDARELEYMIRRPDGEPVYIWSTAEGRRDESGRIAVVAGICVDVTARRRAEAARAAEESRNRALFESAPVGILLCEEDRIVSANRAAQSLFGETSVDRLIGRSPYDYLSESPHASGDDPLFDAVIGRGSDRDRFRVRRVDGSTGSAEMMTASVDVGDGRRLDIMFFADVSAEIEVEAVHRALFAGSQDGILLTWPRQYIIEANAAARDILGLPPGLSARMNSARVFDFDDPEMAAALEQRRRTGRFRGELTLKRLDGSTFRADVVSTLFRTPSGAERSWVVFRDITERLALEERLRRAHRMEAIGQLTDGVAHDFNNLLTVVLGNAEMLVEAPDASVEARRLASDILAAAEHGAELTGRLRAFARRQPLRPEVLDVSAVLRDEETLLRRALRDDIELEIASGIDVPPVEVDRERLGTSLVDILANARDAIERAGSVRIRVERRVIGAGGAEPAVDLPPGVYVAIAISDTGVGMPADAVDRALEPFFTTKPVGEGSGLGLSMVYGFARQSGGTVRIESEPGRGTTVTLLLPAARPAADGATDPIALPIGNERILLVEDDALVREQTRVWLERLGYRIVTAEDAASALVRLERDEDIDLLFTDVALPGRLDGWGLAAALRERRPDVPVLLTSGAADERPAEPGMAILAKPYRRIELARRLRALLGPMPSR